MIRRLPHRLSALALSAVAITGTMTVGSAPAHAQANRSCGPVTSADAAIGAQLNQILTSSMAHDMGDYHVSCARAIVNTVRNLGLPDRAAVIAVTTAIVESRLENNPNVLDATSVGLFQQQEWWGTTEQRLDPVWSTTAFINEMLRTYPNNAWQSQEIGTVCQGVQRSAFPGRYQPQASDAQKIVDAITGSRVPASSLVSGRVATVYNPDTKTSEAFAIDTAG
ncbi:hypothetical protein ACFVSN_45150, partial [Kitasatospora sp. NPDC057904]